MLAVYNIWIYDIYACIHIHYRLATPHDSLNVIGSGVLDQRMGCSGALTKSGERIYRCLQFSRPDLLVAVVLEASEEAIVL